MFGQAFILIKTTNTWVRWSNNFFWKRVCKMLPFFSSIILYKNCIQCCIIVRKLVCIVKTQLCACITIVRSLLVKIPFWLKEKKKKEKKRKRNERSTSLPKIGDNFIIRPGKMWRIWFVTETHYLLSSNPNPKLL